MVIDNRSFYKYTGVILTFVAVITIFDMEYPNVVGTLPIVTTLLLTNVVIGIAVFVICKLTKD